jgi:hypothetical protein
MEDSRRRNDCDHLCLRALPPALGDHKGLLEHTRYSFATLGRHISTSMDALLLRTTRLRHELKPRFKALPRLDR